MPQQGESSSENRPRFPDNSRLATLHVTGPATQRSVLDALEARYPTLRGTIRDHVTQRRRPMLRFFACEEDLSHEPPDAPLPDAVASGGGVLFRRRDHCRRLAGKGRPGERKVVRVTIVVPPSSFQGSTRNGVTSASYGPYPGAYRID